jgi:site-specific recombinase XerD
LSLDWLAPDSHYDGERRVDGVDLLEALPNDTLAQKRDRALILLLRSTGARISEILRLGRSEWNP